MSHLGSFGSSSLFVEPKVEQNVYTPEPPKVNPEEESVSAAESLFTSPNSADHTKGLMMLIAMMSKGLNVSEFAPLVIQEIASNDYLGRQLAYVYLNHYADEAIDFIVLSINTFQKSLQDSDPIVRALALKVMSTIRSREILPAIRDGIMQVAGDTNPFVKKVAAYAIIKAAEISEDESETEQYLPILERLLNDDSPISFSGAIAAYWTLCPDSFELLHKRFRWMCHNIDKLDAWGQIYSLRALTVYARYCFKNPSKVNEDESNAAFWDDSQEAENINPDLSLLLYAAKRMLMSQNAGVVLAAATLIYYCAPPSMMSCLARPLVRLVYDSQITAKITINFIITVASKYNHIFIPHLQHFYVRKNDIPQVKTLKLRLLSVLVLPANAKMVLSELSMYSGSVDLEFAAEAVKTIGKIAITNSNIAAPALHHLLQLLGQVDGKILTDCILSIAHILKRGKKTKEDRQAIRTLARKFLAISDPQAKSAILAIIGDCHTSHPEFAPQLLRVIAKSYNEQHPDVRLQSLSLAARVISTGTEEKVPEFLLKLGQADVEFDIRDRARFLMALVNSKNELLHKKLEEIMFQPRTAPAWTQIDETNNFALGTFSHLFNHEVAGYEPVPEWAPEEQLPVDSVRRPLNAYGEVEEEDDGEEDENGVSLNEFFVGTDSGAEYEAEEEDGAEEEETGDEEVGEEEEEGKEENDEFFN